LYSLIKKLTRGDSILSTTKIFLKIDRGRGNRALFNRHGFSVFAKLKEFWGLVAQQSVPI
jgi:hypothetical protein